MRNTRPCFGKAVVLPQHGIARVARTWVEVRLLLNWLSVMTRPTFRRRPHNISYSGSESLETTASANAPALRNEILPIVWSLSEFQNVAASKMITEATSDSPLRELVQVLLYVMMSQLNTPPRKMFCMNTKLRGFTYRRTQARVFVV